ncbi:carotenoid oxygenase family protein [Mycobacterium sp. AMU20-3851]|uniref:carotenoid oxygenase family protein n=1 Tax=Mycobacterium sp. AMU20-3851 TaxID=3122055 RepID=UPI003753EBFC
MNQPAVTEPAVSAAPLRPSSNPFLAGNYAPVHEELTVADLDVTGTIPDYLDGRYLRVGPNPLNDPDPATHHWFLGDGMAHGLRLADGTAYWYRNRWVRSAVVARALGETWKPGARGAGLDFAGNTNIIGHAGRTLVLTEAGARPYELTEDLETVGGSDFCGTLVDGYSAHPKHDPDTGELHAVSYHPLRGNKVRYTVTGVDGRVRRTVDIELAEQTMMHDFSLTEHYVVLYDMPVVLDFGAGALRRAVSRFVATHSAPDAVVRAVMRGSERTRGGLNGMPYRWAPDKQARVGVLPREGQAGDIRWFEVPQCYVFHPLNAYEEGTRLVLDVVTHPSVFTVGTKLFDPPALDRWTVDLATGAVSSTRLDDAPQEFPRVDERRVGKPHRYGYTQGSVLTADGSTPRTLLRHDLHTGQTRRVTFDQDGEPGEFVFVPASADAAEDDGVVMGFVYRRGTDRSDLVLLDAQTLETTAVVHLPCRVPHGFHGNWVPRTG